MAADRPRSRHAKIARCRSVDSEAPERALDLRRGRLEPLLSSAGLHHEDAVVRHEHRQPVHVWVAAVVVAEAHLVAALSARGRHVALAESSRQAWNAYSYCANNSQTFVDPSGFELSLPRTILGLIDILIGVLEDLVAALRQLVDRLATIARAQERAVALGDDNLTRILGVARDNVATEAAQLGAQLGSVSGVFGLLGVLMRLIGGPNIPNLDRPPVDDLDQFVSTLEGLLQTLHNIRRLVPL